MIRDLSTKDQDKVSELFIHYKCAKNGNYLPLQCTDSVCYCVDEYGYKSSEAKLKSESEEIKELECYKRFIEEGYNYQLDIFDSPSKSFF